MLTDHLTDVAGVDAYVHAAATEIEPCEGCEDQLVMALRSCKQPLPVAEANKN